MGWWLELMFFEIFSNLTCSMTLWLWGSAVTGSFPMDHLSPPGAKSSADRDICFVMLFCVYFWGEGEGEQGRRLQTTNLQVFFLLKRKFHKSKHKNVWVCKMSFRLRVLRRRKHIMGWDLSMMLQWWRNCLLLAWVPLKACCRGKKKNEMCQFLGLKLLLSQACSAKEIFSFSCSDLEWKTSFKLKQKSASGFCFPPNVSKTICSASTCSYFSADLWHPQMQTKQLPVCSARSLWDGVLIQQSTNTPTFLHQHMLPQKVPFLPWPPRSMALLTW